MSEVIPAAERELDEIVDGYHAARLGAGREMSVGFIAVEPGTDVPEHSHENEQIGIVHRGEFTFYLDGTPHELGPGDTYVVDAEVPHYGEFDGERRLECFYVHTPPRELPNWDD